MKQNKEALWWDYVSEFHLECYNEVTADCSRNAHKKLGLDFDKTTKCVDEGFYPRNKPRHQQRHEIFEDEKAYYKDFGPAFFPAVVINNRTYMGVLDPENVFSAICAGFKDSPKECSSHTLGGATIGGVSTTKLIFIIAGLVLINIFLILCYRKYAKKETNEQMQMHINSAVSQYFAL